MEQLRVFAHKGRIEVEQFIGIDELRVRTCVQASDNLTKLNTCRRCTTGNAKNHPVEDQEDRNLEQHRDTTTNGVDLVVLVELHELRVHRVAFFFGVFVLDLLELRLKKLHLEHRLRARQRQWRCDDQHDQCQQHDGYDIGIVDVIEKRQYVSNQIEHQFAFRGGTGSCPWPPQG